MGVDAWTDGRPTALLYCHDTYGLGHLRRTLSLASALRAVRPDLSQLIATGSPLAHAFRLPEGVDYLKLPSVTKVSAERYAPRSLTIPLSDLAALRAEILTAVARRLRPDLFVVDNVPCGLGGEVVPALTELRRHGRTRLVLGLRDVVDEPERIRRAWTRDGSYELLDDLYDRILVYGQEDVFDLSREYGFSPVAKAKTRYVGYLRRGAPPPSRRHDPPLVLVTAGGGGDGFALLRTAIASAQLRAVDARWIVVTGPFLPQREREELVRAGRDAADVELVEFTRYLPPLVATADVVVSMGGYNSVCEILSAQRPAVIVPRVEPRLEQLIRARALERRGLVEVVHPDDLEPESLAHRVKALLARGPAKGAAVDLQGLERAATELATLLARQEPAAVGAAG